MRDVRIFLAWGICLAACGLGPFDVESGGDDNLPQSGAGPYLFPPADFDTPVDEPYILAQALVSLTDPAVRLLPDGSSYEVFYTRTNADGSEIWKVVVESLVELPSEPSLVLSATSSWEGTTVRAPSIVLSGSELFLYYEGGDEESGIGLARSTDGGQTFVKDAANPLIVQARDPDVVIAGERWLMVHGAIDGGEIFVREGREASFGTATPILRARLGVAGAFDALGVGAPALRAQERISGRTHFGLFYEGVGPNSDGEPISSIGYQGSFDLVNWAAFLDGEPILEAGPAGAGGPSPVLFGTESLLFVHQRRQGRGRLAVAYGP